MKKFSIIALSVALAISCVLSVPVSAASYQKISIADHVTGKEVLGDEVIVTYDMPLVPTSDVYGFTPNAENSALIGTYSDIWFTQDIETKEYENITTAYYFGSLTTASGAVNRVQFTPSFTDFDCSGITHLRVNGQDYPVVVTEVENVSSLSWDFSVDNGSLSESNPFRFKCTYVITTGSYLCNFYSYEVGVYEVSLLRTEVLSQEIYEYDYMHAYTWPLGRPDEVYNVIDISDIRSGYGFDLNFAMLFDWKTEGVAVDPELYYTVYYLDETFSQIDSVSGTIDIFDLVLENGPNINYKVSFTVPDGAAYFYPELRFGSVDVTECSYLYWAFSSLTMSCALSALEDNTRTLIAVQEQLDRMEGAMNDYINGDHGFDSSGSDFSGAADDLQNSSSQMNDAISGGMNHLGSMMTSPAFTTTLTTLAAGLDALFVGHEVTICGVTANPFELLVSVLALAILIPLALKFIFRKWGSDSSGGGSDA